MSLPHSEHFTLQALAPGVYAALAADEGGAFANAGIIDLGDRTLQFDTFVTPQAARDLRDAAKQLTGREPSLVAISHAHFDHFQGGIIHAPEVQIISTATNREEIHAFGERAESQDRAQAVAQLQGLIENLRQNLATATDPIQQYDLRFQIGYLTAFVTSAAELKKVSVNTTFEQSMSVDGSQRRATLLTFGGGHSNSDVLLHLPDDDILFAGDLISVKRHPFLGAGHLTEWQRILGEMAALKATQLVPGHGEVGKPDDLKVMGEYIEALSHAVQMFIELDGTAENLSSIVMPEPFRDWKFGAWLFNTNVAALYQKLAGQSVSAV